MRTKTITIALAVAAMLSATVAAHGGYFLGAYSNAAVCNSADPTSATATGNTGQSSVPVLVSASNTWDHYNWADQYLSTSSVTSTLSAGPGALSVTGTARANVSATTSYTSVLTSSSANGVTAEFVIDDFIITNTSNPGDTGTLDNVKLNVHVVGSFAYPESSNDVDSFSMEYYRTYWNGAGQFTSKTAPGSTSLSRGVFRGLPSFQDVDGVFQINLGSVQCGTPFSIGLRGLLTVTTKTSVRGSTNEHSGSFDIEFSNQGPVLDLPAGFTADSVSGGITDNHRVPEPGALALLAMLAASLPRRRGRAMLARLK